MKDREESSPDKLAALLAKVRACSACADALPLGPRPILQLSTSATILIASQAPGSKVHETGVPFSDVSGDRLREWMGLSTDEFYDEKTVAIMPMGFCYPGRGKGGDNPPRPECAPLWHARLRTALPNIKLTLLIGTYAQAHYLGARRKATLGQTVQAWRDYINEGFLPLVHPSPRNQIWLKRNPWFETEIVPYLKAHVAGLMGDT